VWGPESSSHFQHTDGTASEFGNFCGLAPRQGRWAVSSGLRFAGSLAARAPWVSTGTSEQPRAGLDPDHLQGAALYGMQEGKAGTPSTTTLSMLKVDA
jgi:hypothetical protein